MITEIKKLARSSFVRNVATVGAGVVASQAIVMLFAPLITRLYGPESFGLQSVFISLVNILVVIAALGYPAAIVIPKKNSDAIGLVRISICTAVLLSALTAVILSIFNVEILDALNASAIEEYVYLIPVAMLVGVFVEILGQWLIRKKTFSLRAKYAVLSAFIVNASKAFAGLYHPVGSTLIASNVFGGIFGGMLTWCGWIKHRNKNFNSSLEKTVFKNSDLANLAREYRSFPLLWTPQNLINVFSQNLPILALSTFFGASYAGQYSIALAVIALPANMIGGSIMSVFNPRINEAIHSRENLRKLIIKATIGMAAMGFIPYIAAIISGPYLFDFVFGGEWYTSGVYAQILSAFLFVQFISRPAIAAIPALKLQRGFLVYEIFSAASKALGLYVGFALFESDLIAVGFFSLFGILANLWLIAWVFKISAYISSAGYSDKS